MISKRPEIIKKNDLINLLNINKIKWKNEPYYPNAIRIYLNKKLATILFTSNDELMHHTTPDKNALKAIYDLYK